MEEANWDAARLGWDVAQTLIMALIGIYVWWQGRKRATTQAIQQVDGRVTDLNRQVAELENTLQHRPGYGDLKAIRDEMAQTTRSLAEVSAQLQATTALLHRLHDYLLQERQNR